MEHIIIGTAGHIDHGKTALIRALTGRDTDTNKEEKERGITIDLGFTWFDLPNGDRAGIVDVPGHEKFLPNMLSGVYGMDLVLLVIALDEGIKPQTIEHMEILSQLHIENGILVFTKSDLVDEEWKELMTEEIREEIKMLGDDRFAAWPEVCVSSKTGEGIENLKTIIVENVLRTHHLRDTSGAFRMPIDRILSLSGRGTVIAGTILEGEVQPDDKIMLYPKKTETRIRSIQVHGQNVEKATAGQRAALLLPGIKKEELKRGNVAAAIHSLNPSERLDVKITMSAHTGRILKHQSRLHLHIGAGQVLCRVILFGKNELTPGESGYAQLVLEEKIAVKKRDSFVLRFYSPLETIGGGIVLDAAAKKHKRTNPAVVEELKQKEENKESNILLKWLRSQKKNPVTIEQIKPLLEINEEEISNMLCRYMKKQQIVSFIYKKCTYYWSQESENNMWEQMKEWLQKYHQRHPYRYGATKKELQKELFSGWENKTFEAYLSYLESFGQSQTDLTSESDKQTDSRIKRNEDIICLCNFEIQHDKKFQQIEAHILKTLEEAGYQLLLYKELCPPKVDEECFEDIFKVLKKEGKLIEIADSYYVTEGKLQVVIEKVEQHFREHKILTYSEMRDNLEISRKTAKIWIEYLDKIKITMRCGNETERVAFGLKE